MPPTAVRTKDFLRNLSAVSPAGRRLGGGLSLSLSEADARAHGMKSEFLVARSRVLRRLRLNALSALEPAEPIRRYERENPGELIHLDIKKLGRIGSTCTARENSTFSANMEA